MRADSDPRPPAAYISCGWCGKTTYGGYATNPRKYCSPECSIAASRTRRNPAASSGLCSECGHHHITVRRQICDMCPCAVLTLQGEPK